MEKYTIKHLRNQNRFIISNEMGIKVGKLKYDVKQMDNFLTLSTVVNPDYRGQSLGHT